MGNGGQEKEDGGGGVAQQVSNKVKNTLVIQIIDGVLFRRSHEFVIFVILSKSC